MKTKIFLIALIAILTLIISVQSFSFATQTAGVSDGLPFQEGIAIVFPTALPALSDSFHYIDNIACPKCSPFNPNNAPLTPLSYFDQTTITGVIVTVIAVPLGLIVMVMLIAGKWAKGIPIGLVGLFVLLLAAWAGLIPPWTIYLMIMLGAAGFSIMISKWLGARGNSGHD